LHPIGRAASSRAKRGAAGAFVSLCSLRCFVLGFVFFVPFVSPATLHAQMSGAQMPDPKAMSGIPLQVPDVPVGTVTARVIRGALTNPLSGQGVELTGAGGTPQTALTDAAGRATFSGLAPGTRVKAAVVVDGVRIESQEFSVPAAGGMRVMLVATDAGIEKKAAEDRKLAAGPAVSGAVVFGDQSRFVIEVGDDALNVFNILQIVNTAKRPVTTTGPLVFDLPAGASGAGVLEGSAPNAVAAGSRVTITGPFAPGDTLVQFAYSVPLGSDQITLAQRLPAQMTQVSVLAQKIGGMQLLSPQLAERREMAAEGQNYIVGQGGAVKAGDTVTLTLTGLPHRAIWPRNVALFFAAVILATGAWGATRGTVAPHQNARRGQLNTRRDKLFTELAGLEAERRKGTVDAPAYAARRADLVTSLEDLYAELE
jgi:hypothetical protein